MELYTNTVDSFTKIGDLDAAMRYMWADVTSRQSVIDRRIANPFLLPEVFFPQRSGRPVLLKRSFNQKDFKGGFIKYWRVMSSWHTRYQSDLSLLGLQEAGIVR